MFERCCDCIQTKGPDTEWCQFQLGKRKMIVGGVPCRNALESAIEITETSNEIIGTEITQEREDMPDRLRLLLTCPVNPPAVDQGL